jgi:hypothetical protein
VTNVKSVPVKLVRPERVLVTDDKDKHPAERELHDRREGAVMRYGRGGRWPGCHCYPE